MMKHYDLRATAPDNPPDLVAFECDELAEFVEELTELFAMRDLSSNSSASFSLDFRRSGGGSPLPFSIPEAFREAVSVIEGSESPCSVACFFDSQRAVSAVEAMLPGGASADRSTTVGNTQLIVRVGGITRVVSDAIVNASNTRLVLGGGVSYAIKRATKNSEALQSAMSGLAPIGPGDVVVTSSFGMDCSPLILHAATAGGGADIIRRAYGRCLDVAEEHRLEVLGVPALGTGTGGLDMQLCANIFSSVIRGRSASASFPRVVVVVLYNDIPAADLFAAALGAS